MNMFANAKQLLEARLADVFKFRETLTPETDRGCALMAAAYLDAQLEELLRAAWVADDKCLDDVLGQSKPLGTFSSRIDVAYLTGLIGDRARRDLHLIRRIRNDFGHRPEPIGFYSESIANRCAELHHTFRSKDERPRALFTSTVLGVLAIIHSANHKVQRAARASDPEIDEGVRVQHKKTIDQQIETLIELLANTSAKDNEGSA
jgi:DNA-binding MltR family transcriptional regulator